MFRIVFVTFLFAPGLPILLPIALFGLTVQYLTNKVALAYYVKRPPVYDSEMNYRMLKMLKLAPLLYVCMGAWIYSN